MEKIWLSQYQKGVPEEINCDEYNSIVELLEQDCKNYKSRQAFENMHVSINFEQVDELSLKLAAFLQKLNLTNKARIAIMMPNILQYPIAIYAILRAGFSVVNTNPLYTADELQYQINDSGAECIIVLANFAKTVELALAKTPSLKHVIVTEIGDLFPYFKRHIVNFAVKYIKKMIPSFTLTNTYNFRTCLQSDTKDFIKPIIHKDDIAFLQYTGGTTGVSKGAMLSHGNITANILQASAWIKPITNDNNEIIITALPLYHIFSLTANCLTFWHLGAKNILITNPRDIPDFIKTIKNSGFTAITGVNTLFNALIHNPKFKTIDFSKLKLSLSGGMALQKSLAQQWSTLTKAPILEAYGLTETCPAVSINPLYLREYNGSIGLPIPSTEISIRDDNGNELAVEESGELCIKGPQVMLGYWNNLQETSEVFWEDGFLKTGDIAKIDAQGYLYLVDRKKDMILISGFNVYPNEIEQVISQMPEVLEVGVIGVNDPAVGEKVKACIVKKDANLTKEDVLAYCKKHLTAYKIPKIVEFYKELPKTNVGKILRRALQ